MDENGGLENYPRAPAYDEKHPAPIFFEDLDKWL
jgi:hypothetical protein